jgi:hypothetical protein
MWMPLIGTLDIVLGTLILLRPRPAILYWMIVWAIWTALLRPLAHEPVWELFERAGNHGVPVALLCLMVVPAHARDYFATAEMRELSPVVLARVRRILMAAAGTLLIGHGALGVEHKALLVSNYASVVPAYAAAIVPILGWLEILAGFVAFFWRSAPFAVGICVWKLATESLFLTAGAPFWELVERGGSYAVPLALAIVLVLERRSASA